MTENKRYVRILDYSEKEVRIFDEHNQKNIFNIFFEGLDSAICLKGALEDTVDLLNYFYEEKKNLKEENKQLKQFKSKVLELLDEKIKHYEHKPFSAPISQPLSINFDADVDRLARLSELEALKEELQDD